MSIFVSLCLYRYSLLTRLFLQGEKELKYLEETTYGDPIASSIYAIGVLPLLCLRQTSNSFLQVAFVDDFKGTRKLFHVKYLWRDL